MLANEGMIEASAAERGVRGASVARQLVMNSRTFGMSQAMRARGLTQAGYDAREVYGDINRDLKGQLNRSFGKVVIQPIADLPPPKPVMQNVGLTLMLGMGEALAAGIGGMSNTGDGLSNQTTTSNTSFGPSFNTSPLVNMPTNYTPNIKWFE